jgi:hypothetical protein
LRRFQLNLVGLSRESKRFPERENYDNEECPLICHRQITITYFDLFGPKRVGFVRSHTLQLLIFVRVTDSGTTTIQVKKKEALAEMILSRGR